MAPVQFTPLQFDPLSEDEMIQSSRDFYIKMKQRRTVRHCSDKPVPVELIDNAILAAETAPSGANQQPWHFAVVSDQNLKHKIRPAAEEEEKQFYAHRASSKWLRL